MSPRPKTVLWILDYFPRQHDMTSGVWALQSIFGLTLQGVDVVVLSPTPWIPRPFAFNKMLRNWADVPATFEIVGVPIFYPKCLHYPHRLVTRYLYNHFPSLDSALVWPSCKKTVAKIMQRYPIEAIHANFIFPSGYLGRKIKEKYGIPLIVYERSLTRLTETFAKPIIACEGQGVAESIQDGVQGLLVKPRDVDSLFNAILTLLQEPEKRTEMGRAAAELARSSLNYDVVASKIRQVYARVVPQ